MAKQASSENQLAICSLESGSTTHQRLVLKRCATLTVYVIAKIYIEKCRVDEEEIEQRISGSSEDQAKFEKYDAHDGGYVTKKTKKESR